MLILKTTISRMERLQRKVCGAVMQIKEIDKEIAELNGRNLVLTRLNAKGILRPAEYREQSGNIDARVGTLRTERRRLLQEQDEGSVLSRLRQLDSLLAELEYPITEFDEELFENIIEKVTVPSETSLCFHLIGGLSLSELIGGCV